MAGRHGAGITQGPMGGDGGQRIASDGVVAAAASAGLGHADGGAGLHACAWAAALNQRIRLVLQLAL